jgi:hypothetical protein
MRRGLQPAAIDTPLQNSRENAGRRSNNRIEPPISEAARSPFFCVVREVGDARRRAKAIERFFSELAGDGAEGGAEIGADEGEGGDCRDCDQCGDQSIFDGGNPGLVPDQIGKKGAQADSPQGE